MSTAVVENYFYAEEDAELYDATVELTTEAYGLLHRQIARLIQSWTQRQTATATPVILDIGAGTGAEALSILRASPQARLICVDASSHMLEALHRKVSLEFGDPTAGGRCTTVVADAYSPGWLKKVVDRFPAIGGKFDLIVSVYLFHHLDAGRKGAIYQEIGDHLVAGGAFLHGDLFSFADADLSRQAQNLEDSWLTSSFANPTIISQAGLTASQAKRLVEAWLRHYREDNRPLPITAAGDRLDDATELALLSKAGFRSCEVPFRFFQNGVIWAAR